MKRFITLVPWPTDTHCEIANKVIMGMTANFYGDAEDKMKSVRLPKVPGDPKTIINIKSEIVEFANIERGKNQRQKSGSPSPVS